MKTCLKCNNPVRFNPKCKNMERVKFCSDICAKQYWTDTHRERTRKASTEFYNRNKDKVNAIKMYFNKTDPNERFKLGVRNKLNSAIRKGIIKRKSCEKCSNPKVEGHHKDYSKPLEVKWLCRQHHVELHWGENLVKRR